MRWKEVLVESVKKYLPMFSMFANEQGQMPAWVSNRIASIEALLKRHDRIVWALRWERLAARHSIPMTVRGKAARIEQKLLSELRLDAANEKRELELYDTMIRDHFAHWLSMPIPAIQNFVFDRQMPNEIWTAFTEAEEAWTKSRSQLIKHAEHYPETGSRHDNDEDDEEDDVDFDDAYADDDKKREKEQRLLRSKGKIEKFIDFGNGWAWWDLNRSYCRVEGGAMGHCGNSASATSGQTVLSLRRDMGDGTFRPSLTFIDDSGWLGEMKGRANEKPSEKYHAMITALLRDPRIKGCRGGGYAAGNNFSVLDLPEAEREELLAEKPTLMTMPDRLRLANENPSEKNKTDLVEALRADMKDHGFRFDRIELGGRDEDRTTADMIIIKDYGTREDYTKSWACTDQIKHLTNFFGELEEDLVGYQGMSAFDAGHVALSAERTYYDQVFDAILPYTQPEEFMLDGVWIGVLKGHVVTQISFRDYMYPTSQQLADEETGPIFDEITELDATGYERSDDWRDIGDSVVDHLDETAAVLAECAFKNRFESALAAIYDRFSDDESGYLSRHPDQGNFDF